MNIPGKFIVLTEELEQLLSTVSGGNRDMQSQAAFKRDLG